MKVILLFLCLFLTTNCFASSEIKLNPFVVTFNQIKHWYKVDTTIPMGVIDLPKHNLKVIAFQARTNDETQVPMSFMVIGRQVREEFKPIQYVSGNDYFDKIELIKLGRKKDGYIFFWQEGGAHYTNLDVYRMNDNVLKMIFENGSACGMTVDNKSSTFNIRIDRENWKKHGWSMADCGKDNLYEIWSWEGDRFVYNKHLSTSKLVSEREATEKYIEMYKLSK